MSGGWSDLLGGGGAVCRCQCSRSALALRGGRVGRVSSKRRKTHTSGGYSNVKGSCADRPRGLYPEGHSPAITMDVRAST